MKVVIRTDSSLNIGTGHLMRCLALAEELSSRGAEVSFICRDLPGNMNQQVERNGHRLHRLAFNDSTMMNNPEFTEYEWWLAVDKKTDAEQTEAILSDATADYDLLIVDHYALDREWERVLRPYVGRLMVIDDLANRVHDCDILLDQNLYENMHNRYNRLVGDAARLLLGPTYVLLRREFRQWREKITERNGTVRRVLVSFGGADRTNETMEFLEALSRAEKDKLEYVVVVGKTNPHSGIIEDLCAARPNMHFYRAVDDMARLMAETDLAVGAGGTSTWERCCLGLPAVTLAVAENQIEVARLSQEKGFAVYLGTSDNVEAVRILETVECLAKNPDKLLKMSANGMKLVDGLGAERVSDVLCETVEAGKCS